MENRNATPFYGTLAGSPVTLTPHFGRAQEWVIENLDAANSYTATFPGTTTSETIPPGNVVTIRLLSDSMTIDGTGDYSVVCSEQIGAIKIIRAGG